MSKNKGGRPPELSKDDLEDLREILKSKDYSFHSFIPLLRYKLSQHLLPLLVLLRIINRIHLLHSLPAPSSPFPRIIPHPPHKRGCEDTNIKFGFLLIQIYNWLAILFTNVFKYS